MNEELTVVCAAWHRQANLELFYAQHRRSLLEQSVGVRIIYVADGALQLPDGDDRVTVINVDRGVSTAQALMLGLAVTETEYFAALNLDDYYFTDAAAAHLEQMRTHNLDMVAGDWEIRHRPEAHTDRPCMPLSALRPCPQWPPSSQPGQRLGSGDGARATFGPGPVFRTSALRGVGGYPRQFGDGTQIKTIIDYVVWDRLARSNARVARLPLVVGTYYSNPAGQQEFRAGGNDAVIDEHAHYRQYGALI